MRQGNNALPHNAFGIEPPDDTTHSESPIVSVIAIFHQSQDF